jgi:cation transport ATPase
MTASAKPDFRFSKETYIAALALLAIILHLAFRFAVHFPPLAYNLPLFASLFAAGPLLWVLLKKLLKREFGADLLAGISIITAVILGQYLVAAIVVLMLSGGEALEEFATARASSILDALARRVPSVAHRREPAGLKDVKLADIRVGDELTVLPHEICPVDGTVLEGHGVMDEAYLTGEPYQISKTPGSMVISGAINGEAAIVIRADKVSDDSRYARIMKVMHDTEQQRPQLRRLGDQLGAWYTPLAVGVAVIAAVVSHNAERFLAVVVIATPCPLLLAIPTAIIGAISLAARRAIIIKNPSVLEQISKCRTVFETSLGECDCSGSEESNGGDS